jgi:hypothetical protein
LIVFALQSTAGRDRTEQPVSGNGDAPKQCDGTVDTPRMTMTFSKPSSLFTGTFQSYGVSQTKHFQRSQIGNVENFIKNGFLFFLWFNLGSFVGEPQPAFVPYRQEILLTWLFNLRFIGNIPIIRTVIQRSRKMARGNWL